MSTVIWKGFAYEKAAENFARTCSFSDPDLFFTVVRAQDDKVKHEPENRYYVGSHSWPVHFWLRPMKSFKNGELVFPRIAKSIFAAPLIFVFMFLFSFSGICQHGMYLPTVQKIQNSNVYSVDSAHYILSGDQCYVFGRFTIRNSDSSGASVVKISVPFTLFYSNKNPAAGNCFVNDNISDPLTGFCYSTFSDGGKIQAYYKAPSSGVLTVNYFFIYTLYY